MIDLKHVKTFLAIAEQGNFSRAAEALDMAQPTVSIHIKTLEGALGYDLFDRVGKYAVMTPAGKQFLGYAQEMIDLAGQAQSIGARQQKLSDSITVCFVESICTYVLPPVLREFHQQAPQVKINIIASRPSTYMLHQLRDGEFDAAVVFEEPFDIPSLATERLWTEQLQLIASPNHPLSKIDTVSLPMLKHETFIMLQQGAHYRRIFERRARESGLIPNIAFEIESVEAIKRFVMEGIGLTVLPSFTIEAEVASGRLVPLTLAGQDTWNVVVQLIWHQEKMLKPAAKALIDFIINYAKSNRKR